MCSKNSALKKLRLQMFSASCLWGSLHVDKFGKIQNIHSVVHWLKIKSLGKIICEITFTEGMVRYRMGAVLGREHPNRDGGRGVRATMTSRCVATMHVRTICFPCRGHGASREGKGAGEN